MAIIKKSELKQFTPQQMDERLVELKKELMKINTQRAMGTSPDNPGRVRELKRTIARIYGLKANPAQKEITNESKEVDEKK